MHWTINSRFAQINCPICMVVSFLLLMVRKWQPVKLRKMRISKKNPNGWKSNFNNTFCPTIKNQSLETAIFLLCFFRVVNGSKKILKAIYLPFRTVPFLVSNGYVWLYHVKIERTREYKLSLCTALYIIYIEAFI